MKTEVVEAAAGDEEEDDEGSLEDYDEELGNSSRAIKKIILLGRTVTCLQLNIRRKTNKYIENLIKVWGPYLSATGHSNY